MSDKTPAIFADPEEAPPLHQTDPSNPSDPSNSPTEHRQTDKPENGTRRLAKSVAEAGQYQKLEQAFVFVPVWQRFDHEKNEWVTYPLKWSNMRRMLWWRMIGNICPLPGACYSRYTTATAFDGWCAVFLASHEPDQFAHLLGNPARFAEVITEWATREIPEDDWKEVTDLAWELNENSERTAVRLPQRPGRGTVGNVPSL